MKIIGDLNRKKALISLADVALLIVITHIPKRRKGKNLGLSVNFIILCDVEFYNA